MLWLIEYSEGACVPLFLSLSGTLQSFLSLEAVLSLLRLSFRAGYFAGVVGGFLSCSRPVCGDILSLLPPQLFPFRVVLARPYGGDASSLRGAKSMCQTYGRHVPKTCSRPQKSLLKMKMKYPFLELNQHFF